MVRPIAVALGALLLVPAVAHAGEPVMGLRDVRPGMQCTASSVLRGAEISTFDAEVLDVVLGATPALSRILVRFSGPAIEATGIGQGFSGSPIRCPDAEGTPRIIGAISESVGEYGGRTGLAAPIEAILAEPVDPPVPAARSAPRSRRTASRRAGGRAARATTGPRAPLSIGGLDPRLAAIWRRAAARAGRTLVTTPAASRQALAPAPPLVPGSSVFLGLSAGDLSLGALGTVAYVDDDRVWAFGHPYEGAGRRSLFMQAATVHTVVTNPISTPEITTYKLGSPTGTVGTITGDGVNAVTGRQRALPPSFPLRVTAKDMDTGRTEVLVSQVADESDVGFPGGTSPLAMVGTAGVAQASSTVLGASPSRQRGEMCVDVDLREVRRPLRFCNTYVGGVGAAPGTLPAGVVSDMTDAMALVDTYRFGTLHPEGVEVGLRLRRAVGQAFMLAASGPEVVRRGRTTRVRVALKEVVTGRERRITVRVRVPRSIPRGDRMLALSGTPADAGPEGGLEGEVSLVLGGEHESPSEIGPTSLRDLRAAFEGLERFDGIRASFPEPGEDALDELLEEGGVPPGPEGAALRERPVYRDRDLRISGDAAIPVRVR